MYDPVIDCPLAGERLLAYLRQLRAERDLYRQIAVEMAERLQREPRT